MGIHFGGTRLLTITDVALAQVGGWIVGRSEAFKQHLYNSTLDFTIPVTFSEDVSSKFKLGGKFSRVARDNDVNALFDGSSDPDYYNATSNFFLNHPGLSAVNPAMFTDLWAQNWKRGTYFLNVGVNNCDYRFSVFCDE